MTHTDLKALVQSGSISVFSAVVDSALDIFNGIVIFFVSRSVCAHQ